MKRSLLPFLLLLFAAAFAGHELHAQSGPYGNEWIDYSKTYYKFKVGKTGVCRIYRSSLVTAGVPASVLGSNFALYRDGQEVPVWVSAENMSGSDYIEFAGHKGDGLLDRELYGNPGNHSDDRISLFNDTASYYLMYDGGSNHLRYVQAANTIPGGTLTPEPYCLSTVGFYPRSAFIQGPTLSTNGGDELTSSIFESGEGFVQSFEFITAQVAATLLAPNLVPGVAATLHSAIITRSYTNSHQVKLLFNNSQLADSAVGIAATKHFDITIPAAALAASNDVRFAATSIGTGTYDGYGLSFAELEYPRNFDMAGVTQADFRLPATGAAQYLEFTNFGGGRLYDVSARKWYDGNTPVGGKTRFYLDPAFTTRQIVVISNSATGITALLPVKTIHFTNYGSAASQGTYMLISNEQLMQPAGGRNYVQEYGAYRASAAGGSHSVVTADVTELYDQFAYGYDIHPLSIKHFLKYALDKWTVKPADVLLVGRGLLYNDYARYRANPALYPYSIVPTYGNPGSDVDFVMFGDQVPRMHIGRLSVWNAPEIGIYLSKVQAYEAALPAAAMPTTATELWKKRVMHVIGAADRQLQLDILEPTMAMGAVIISDTFTGKKVTTIAKSDNQAITNVNSAVVDSLLRGGLSMISFYGHASPYVFDYNLPAPESYTSSPRLPFFTALGCDVAQMFQLAVQKSIAERYILANNSGAVGFLASDNVSFTGFDDNYLFGFYHSIAHSNYGASMGTHYNAAHNALTSTGTQFPDFNSAQLESMIYAGDPALNYPAPAKPDYHVSADGINSIPASVTTSLDSFRLRINAYNLGKAILDTVVIKVEHINPKGVVSTVKIYSLHDLHISDTSTIMVPVHKVDDLGLNKYRVTIDAPNRYDEVSELNNVAVFDLFIYSDNLVPVYPKEFAIVNKQGVTLKASTLNPFRPMGRYRLELDTTELFNSPLKQQTAITSPGGVIKWTPAMQMTDSVVYYWRAAFDSTVNGSYQWTNSSFIYLAQSSPGWNQSHYYQYAKDNSTTLFLNADRKFRFGTVDHKLQVANMVLGGTGNYDADGVYVRTYWDDIRIEQSSYGGVYCALQVLVVDSASGRIWLNDGNTPGSPPPASFKNGTYSRQFNLADPSARNAAARFLDSIPNGAYMLVKNVWWHNFAYPAFTNVWKADSTSAGGLSNTLYGAMIRLGFTTIDSFNRERVFVFMRRKGDAGYPVFQQFTDSLTGRIEQDWVLKGSDIAGQWNSTVIGPAKAWESFKWQTGPYDANPGNDTASVSIIGIDASGNETLIYPRVTGDTTLAGISAQQYPELKLVWNSKDSVNTSSTQLRYWRVLYTPVPEAALNPAAHYAFSDSLSQGQMQTFSTAIENLTELPMDSMLVRYRIIGADGVTRLLGDRRYRPLPGLDTLHAAITFDPAPYPGKNIFFVEANPANDQPEEYHPNNLGYIPFRIAVDAYNPLLDVTFDAVHILNGDIVSAKPFIKIRLKDENRYLALDDTGLLKVSLRYPSDSGMGVGRPIPFDGSRCRFIPATSGSAANEAVVEFRPMLTEDGKYQLRVSGEDKSGNGAGANSGSAARSTYTIEFEVDNKPGVTNVLNYPNPFSTATAFVFTLTGAQIPSQFKIQILSVTGKVVREIIREELGPLHIGRNITEYQWDGRDQYGQLLGNGVYLYRIVSSLNGQDMDLRSDTREMSNRGGGIDKYFKNGYGKMYIMR